MKKMFLLLAAVLAVSGVGAQTAAAVDELLAAPAISFSQAASFLLPAAGKAPEAADAAACFAQAVERGWIPRGRAAGDAIRLDEFAFLAMGAFDRNGGLWCRLSPGPRYAFRDLVYGDIIQGLSDPSQKVSGDRALRVIGRLLDSKGGES